MERTMSMATSMERTSRRSRQGRGVLVTAAGQRRLDNTPVGSERVINDKPGIFGAPMNHHLDGRWLHTVTKRSITREATPW